MTTFNVTITNTSQLNGITAARNAYNAANVSVVGFTPIAADADYVQFVMASASASYAAQYKT